MATTILAENALTLPVSTTRPTGSQGAMRFNDTTKVYENYHDLSVGTDNWYGTGGRQLIARGTANSAWNTFDIIWGKTYQRYLNYEVNFCFQDGATNVYRMYCQFYDENGSLFQLSGGNGYTYTDNFGSANDGGDGAAANFNAINSNAQSYFPVSSWYSNDSGYWSAANGESANVGSFTIFQSIPTSYAQNIITFKGSYTHYTPSYGSLTARFGGSAWGMSGGSAATNGQPWYPITGIRFGYLDGYTARAVTGVNAVVTVYGLSGTEERDL